MLWPFRYAVWLGPPPQGGYLLSVPWHRHCALQQKVQQTHGALQVMRAWDWQSLPYLPAWQRWEQPLPVAPGTGQQQQGRVQVRELEQVQQVRQVVPLRAVPR